MLHFVQTARQPDKDVVKTASKPGPLPVVVTFAMGIYIWLVVYLPL